MTTALATQTTFDREQIDLIKRTIAVGATDDELKLFVMQAQRMGLDPFARQIHAVKRNVWNPDTRESESRMTIQVGIDGYRLVADRTGRYAPGRASTYDYDADGKLLSATAYVMKMVGNQWHECAATAHFSEYAQTKKDGSPTAMWASKPHIMLGKCAEALALRRAFPAELSGVYTDDEMGQADVIETPRHPAPVSAKSAELPAPVEYFDQAEKAAANGVLSWLDANPEKTMKPEHADMLRKCAAEVGADLSTVKGMFAAWRLIHARALHIVSSPEQPQAEPVN